jgi:uncharacterized protein YecT (DUF1311 family)
MKLILLMLFTLLGGATMAQSRATLDSLDKHYQECLSLHSGQYNCAQQYYHSMDSLLRRSYSRLCTQLDSSRRQSLLLEQQDWEDRKSAYFDLLDARVDKQHKSTLSGLDDRVISTDNKAAYLRNRVLQLARLDPH